MYFGFSFLLRPGFILQLGSREPYGLKDQKKQKSFFCGQAFSGQNLVCCLTHRGSTGSPTSQCIFKDNCTVLTLPDSDRDRLPKA